MTTNNYFAFQRDTIQSTTSDIKWKAAVNIIDTTNVIFKGNSIAGAEKVGLITPGSRCDDEESHTRFEDNEVSMLFLFIYSIGSFVSKSSTKVLKRCCLGVVTTSKMVP